MNEVGDKLLSLMVLDPIEAYLAVNEVMYRAGEDLATAERQRDELLALIKERVGVIEPRADCDCMDCDTLRKAREIVKSCEEKLRTEGDGG